MNKEKIRLADRDDNVAIIEVLARAFEDDPVVDYMTKPEKKVLLNKEIILDSAE
jgi:hypothetical protein